MSRRTCHELGVCNGHRTIGCTCHQANQHDTRALPPGGFFFAPGAIEHGPRRTRRIGPLGRLVLQGMGALAVAGLLGFAAGWLQVAGWPL
jgi:hypothetical protein